MKKQLEILEMAEHRNGVGGTPFRVILFKDPEEDGTMVAIQFQNNEVEDFDEFGGRSYLTAVLNVEKLGANRIGFGDNSWRGDRYQDRIVEALTDSLDCPDCGKPGAYQDHGPECPTID